MKKSVEEDIVPQKVEELGTECVFDLERGKVNKLEDDPNNYIYNKNRVFTYVDVGFEAMGNFGALLIYALVCTCNLGGCTVYLVFIGKLMNSMVPQLSDRLWMLFAMSLLIPISWIRNYKYMSLISFAGILSLLIAAGSVIVYGFTDMLSVMHWPKASYVNWSTLPLFFGVSLFLFNNHSSVLPIEQNMRNRKHYPWTLNFSYGFVLVTNLTFALLCYCFFGEEVADDVTKNLPISSTWVIVIKSLLIVELLFSYGVIMMPVTLELVDSKILSGFERNTWKFSLSSTGLRTCVALITLAVAEIFGNRFALVMSFIGGISPNALGFIMPSLFYLIIMRRKYNFIVFMLNSFIISIGAIGMIWNTYTVITELITQIKSGTF